MPVKFVLVHCQGARCPTCDERLRLLQRGDGRNPMFYICWTCEEVRQLGVGLVEEEKR